MFGCRGKISALARSKGMRDSQAQNDATLGLILWSGSLKENRMVFQIFWMTTKSID